jgi:hypothetical protein
MTSKSVIINGHHVHIEVTGDDKRGWSWWLLIDSSIQRRMSDREHRVEELAWSEAEDEAEFICNKMPIGDRA